jgi:NAD(P)-dependent dehydrogenase (short-subunit alcohol dehydrogenase family)
VTVNAVCPAYTDTALLTQSARRVAARTGRSEADVLSAYAAANPAGRLVEPEEVARVVTWLCRPEQADVSGRAIVVDGRNDPYTKARAEKEPDA